MDTGFSGEPNSGILNRSILGLQIAPFAPTPSQALQKKKLCIIYIGYHSLANFPPMGDVPAHLFKQGNKRLPLRGARLANESVWLVSLRCDNYRMDG